jgi:RNA polymerase sigma-70 factor (ECF subfamily)
LSNPFDTNIAVSDELLMERFQSGDAQAFQSVFDRYSSHIINFTYRFLKSREESEDIAQEVFVRVYNQKDRYDASRPFRPWLFSIAMRLTLNRLRDRKRHATFSVDEEKDGDDPKVFSELPDKALVNPPQILERQMTVQKVQEALHALPENQRIAVVLARFEGMSHEEISQVMDISVVAVKSLLFRARQTLKTKLSSYVEKESEKAE